MICPHRKQLSAAVRLLYEEVKAHCETVQADALRGPVDV
jgi:hypothetical protein